jgi:hypothetical protein
MVHVHEWGVVRFDGNGAEVVGAPRSDDYYSMDGNMYGDYCVEAPVVWFHGTSCSGTFSVTTPEGWLTELYPAPDEIRGLEPPGFLNGEFPERNIGAVWSITIGGAEPMAEEVREWYTGLPYEWAAGSWREVPAEYLYRDSDGFCDRFIYYECGLPGDWNDLFHSEDSNIVFESGYTGEGIVMIAGSMPGYLPVRLEGEFSMPAVAGFYPAEPDSIMSILSSWAGGMLKPAEIEALWNTWESTFFAGPGSWLLFPLPPEAVDRISRIEFTPDDCFVAVRYERLFLGLVSIGG